MRTDWVVAAGALMGLADAGVHKMKLQKIPLSKQLVSITALSDVLLYQR